MARFISKHADGGPNDLHRGTRKCGAVILRPDHTLDRGGTALGDQWRSKEKRRAEGSGA